MDVFSARICMFMLLGSFSGIIARSTTSICDDIDYKILNDQYRNAEKGGYADLCDVETTWTKSPDWHGPGWYRMMEPAGTVIPENPVDVNQCGTYSPGWLNGTHPEAVGEPVRRKVCFNYEGHYEEHVVKNNPICYRNAMIQIINCGDFYLYNLSDTVACPLRYCSISKT